MYYDDVDSDDDDDDYGGGLVPRLPTADMNKTRKKPGTRDMPNSWKSSRNKTNRSKQCVNQKNGSSISKKYLLF
jgi:hypothetical protein